jgi:exopolysaccharide biosynthesis WecB/TagA/CpsF family protein
MEPSGAGTAIRRTNLKLRLERRATRPVSLLSPRSRPEAPLVRRRPQIDSALMLESHPDSNGKEKRLSSYNTRAKRVSLMGIRIDALTEKEAIDRIITDWREGRGGWVVTPNLDQIRIFCEQPELNETIAAKATLMLADGMPLVWASRLQGTPLPERVAGSEIILSLTAAAAEAGASIFFLGGNPGTGERAAALMTDANPGLKVAGILSPPMGFEKDPEMVAAIRDQVIAAKPGLIYSCFGFPKQEWLIQQLQEHLPGSWFLGLGGSLSMIAGEFKKAPAWMRRTGLEWICRLMQEPRRLFTRYIIHDVPFALRLLGSAVWHRWTAGDGTESPRRSIPVNSPAAAPQVPGVVSYGGGAMADEETRERILRRYASMGTSGRRHRAAARLKQFAWIALLTGANAAKRMIDIVGALIMLLALSPILMIFALLVKVTSRGPVFFAQTRVGERGRLFKMYKFRSMCADAESLKEELLGDNEVPGGVTFKIKNDPRRTPLGTFMRTWSVDELPQLWNVLKGDMSLVGPRPPLPAEVQKYTLAQRRRLDAIPGLTCIWQVSGRSEIPFERQVELDTEYIDSQSVSLDVRLLFRTVSAVLQRRGAY